MLQVLTEWTVETPGEEDSAREITETGTFENERAAGEFIKQSKPDIEDWEVATLDEISISIDEREWWSFADLIECDQALGERWDVVPDDWSDITIPSWMMMSFIEAYKRRLPAQGENAQGEQGEHSIDITVYWEVSGGDGSIREFETTATAMDAASTAKEMNNAAHSERLAADEIASKAGYAISVDGGEILGLSDIIECDDDLSDYWGDGDDWDDVIFTAQEVQRLLDAYLQQASA